MKERDPEKRARILQRLREIVTEARYIAREQDLKILERYMVSALICVNDLEKDKPLDS